MFRSVFRWMLALVLLGAGVGGAYVYHLYGQADEILRMTLVAKMSELAPGWDIELGRCRFNLRGEIIVDDIKLRVGEERQQLVEVPQAVIVIDRDRFLQKQTVVTQVRLYRPHVWLTREASGQWNVERLPPREKSNSQVAEWRIEDATITLKVADPHGDQSSTLVLRNADAELVPSGKRRLLIQARGGLDLTNGFTAEGEWDLVAERWQGKATIQQLKVGNELQDVALRASPSVGTALEKLDVITQQVLESRRDSQPNPDVVPASLDQVSPARGLGLSALADVTLTMGQTLGEPLDWKASVHVSEGDITNVLLPFPLYGLSADLEADAQAVRIRKLTAHSGQTSMSLSGAVSAGVDQPAANLTFTCRDLPCDPRVRACLTGGVARIYDQCQPHGRCDIALKLSNSSGAWTKTGTLSFKDSTVTHSSFPLRCEQVNGTIVLGEQAIKITMSGKASRRLLTLNGTVTNPGPECSVVLDLRGTGVPLDERFRAACSPKVQAIWDHLRIQGEFDGHVQIIRPAGRNQLYKPIINARLKDCTLQPASFPYVVTEFTARLSGSGMVWDVSEAFGRHDQAVISGHGSTRGLADGRCRVSMHVEANGAALDAQLQAALQERWQKVWKEFNPSGRVNIKSDVTWIEKEKPDVDLDAEFFDAAMVLRSFPYALDNVQTHCALKDGLLTISKFSARHEDMRLQLRGSGNFNVPGEWRVRLEDILVDDLTPDRPFRKALPEKIRQVVETLDPRDGKLGLSGMLELAGTEEPGGSVTSAWDLQFIHSGTTMTTGVDLEDLFGTVYCWGTWDGEEVAAEGKVDFDSLIFRAHQLTKVRGPFNVQGTQLVIGSKDAVNHNPTADGQLPVKPSERLTAEFIDGMLALDGVVKLSDQTDYRVKMTLEKGRLEKYVELYLPGQRNLMGLMRGTLDLSGKGNSARSLTGRGQLVISPASLYELPVIVAIFNILKFVPPDKTAFRSAGFDFKVSNEKFFFERIQLVGDAISLAGTGIVGFDGKIGLDFYSRGGKAQIPVPIIGYFANQAANGFIRVTVNGTTSQPKAVIQTMPQMDDGLRNLLGIFTGPTMRR